MKKVAVIFFRGKGIMSALIRWQTRGDFAHCAVLFDGDGGTFYEAWTGSGKHLWTNGGVAKKLNWKIPEDATVAPFLLPDEQVDKMRTFSEAQLGKKYGYRSIFRFLTREKAVDDNKYFCSELVMDILLAGGIRCLHAPSSTVSPAMLWLSPVFH